MFSIVLLLSLGVTATTKSNALSTGAQTILQNLLRKGSFGLSQIFDAEGRGVTGGGFITQNPITVVDSMVNPAVNPIVVNVVNQVTSTEQVAQVVQTPFGQTVGSMADSAYNFVGSGFNACKNAGHAVRDFNYTEAFNGIERIASNTADRILVEGELAGRRIQDGTQQLLDSARHAGQAVRDFDYAGTAQAVGTTLKHNAHTVADALVERAQSVAQVAKNELADLKEGLGVAGQQVQHAAEFAQGYVADAVVNVPQAAQAGVERLQDGFHAVAALTVDGLRQAGQTVLANPTGTAQAAFDSVKDAIIANPGKTLFGVVGAYTGNRLAKDRGIVAKTMATAAGALAANFVSEEMARIALVAGVAGKFVVANVKAVRAKGAIKEHERNVAIVDFVTSRILEPQEGSIQSGLNIISKGDSAEDICNSPYKYDYFTGIGHCSFLNLQNNKQKKYQQQVKDQVLFLHALPENLKQAVVTFMISSEDYMQAIGQTGKTSEITNNKREIVKESKRQLRKALAPYQAAIKRHDEAIERDKAAYTLGLSS